MPDKKLSDDTSIFYIVLIVCGIAILAYFIYNMYIKMNELFEKVEGIKNEILTVNDKSVPEDVPKDVPKDVPELGDLHKLQGAPNSEQTFPPTNEEVSNSKEVSELSTLKPIIEED